MSLCGDIDFFFAPLSYVHCFSAHYALWCVNQIISPSYTVLIAEEAVIKPATMVDVEAVPIGRREQKRKATNTPVAISTNNASLSLIDDEIQRLTRELDEESSHAEDDEEEQVDIKKEVDLLGHVLILSTPCNELDRIQPLHSGSLPSNTCKTKVRGSASVRVEKLRETIQWSCLYYLNLI